PAPPARVGRTSTPTTSTPALPLTPTEPSAPAVTETTADPDIEIQSVPEEDMSSSQDVRDAIMELTKNQAKLQDVVSDLVSGLSTTKSQPLSCGLTLSPLSPRIVKRKSHLPLHTLKEMQLFGPLLSETINQSNITGSGIAFPYNTWKEFVTAFKTCFKTTDAKQLLKRLYQNRTTVGTYASTFQQPSTVTAPFTTPTRDPNTMDIDATTTRSPDAFRRFMIGRCYGCGSKEHRKADGHHERDICRHCGLNGHVEAVCRCKFLGLPGRRTTTISATSIPDTPQSATPSTTIAATPDLAQLLKELAANQQVLAGQIAELHKNF
ncbi:hypothetical protein EV368DRAFT_89519, partial [Lentinula lateritia]